MIRITKEGIIAEFADKPIGKNNGLNDLICPICLEIINELDMEDYYESNTDRKPRKLQCCCNCSGNFELESDIELRSDVIPVKTFKEFMLYAVKNHKKNEKVWEYVLKKVKQEKKWAKNHEYANNPDKWPACKYSIEMLKELLESTVEELAEKKYRYFEWRALTISTSYSYTPLDPHMRNKWEEITGETL